MYFVGSYDECLDIPNDLTEYCMVSMVIPLPTPVQLPFSVGMCLPKQCSEGDIYVLLDLILGLKVAYNPLMPAEPISCQSYKDPPYHWTAIAMITVCCLIAGLVLLCTLADLIIQLWRDGTIRRYLKCAPKSRTVSEVSDETPLLGGPVKKQQHFDPVEWVQAFSLYKTVPTILSTKQTSAAIRCLNGIRVISMLWVILCHTNLWVSLTGVDNALDFLDTLKRFSYQAVSNGFFSVDSFFFLSGVLVAYLTLRQMKRKNGRFPYLMYYIHRYLRLTPVYAFILFFTWFMSMHLANGPHYKAEWEGGAAWQLCDKYWWTNLLYINNLHPWKFGEECIGWTWYLANDMQFFVISPLIIIPMYFLLPVGLAIAAALLLVSFITTAVLSGVYDFQANTFAYFAYSYVAPHNITTSSQDLLYGKPWHRIQPYLVGLVLGYLLYKQIKIPFSRYFKLTSYLLMWCLAIILCMSTVYGLYGTWHGHTPSLGENIVYNTFSRFAWAVGLALLVFACHNGYGGPINSFLSMSVWTPLSRLTYNAYLIHPVVLTVVFGSMRTTVHYGDIQMAIYAVANAVISFGVAFVLAVFVEFPFGNLEMAFFKLFGVGARESTRADTEAKRAVSPMHTHTYVGGYSTNADSKPHKASEA